MTAGARRVVRGEAYGGEHAPGKGRPSAALATAALPEDRTNDLTRRPNTRHSPAGRPDPRETGLPLKAVVRATPAPRVRIPPPPLR